MTAQHFYAQLVMRDTHFEASFSGDSDASAEYQFLLFRNQVTLGDVEIDRFWMPIRSLYGQRNVRAVNRDSLVEFWWTLCGNEGSQFETAIQQTYLLAKILPHARSNGSRRVFVDSFQTVPEFRSRRMRMWARDLDQLLSAAKFEEYDELAFQRATGNLIGPPAYGDEVRQRYDDLSIELFQGARDAIDADGPEAIERVLADWRKLFNSIGRHRGNIVEKQVLDVLSYECRAALHRCYSLVWSILLPALGDHYAMCDESYIFHQLWHFDRCRESDHGDEAYFHLFHGHIFALHPACGPVLLTQRGGELFAQWLREGTRASYHRVLHALAVAVGYYANQNNIAVLLRKGAASTETHGDMVAVEEQQAERRQGRRRRHRPVD